MAVMVQPPEVRTMGFNSVKQTDMPPLFHQLLSMSGYPQRTLSQEDQEAIWITTVPSWKLTKLLHVKCTYVNSADPLETAHINCAAFLMFSDGEFDRVGLGFLHFLWLRSEIFKVTDSVPIINPTPTMMPITQAITVSS